MYQNCSSYLERCFDDLDGIIEAVEAEDEIRSFDSIVGTGLSGGLVVPIVARALSKKFALVRKPGVDNHGSTDIEGQIGERWLFLDDLIASGRTLSRVVNKVLETDVYQDGWVKLGQITTFVGSYLYYDRKYSNRRVRYAELVAQEYNAQPKPLSLKPRREVVLWGEVSHSEVDDSLFDE